MKTREVGSHEELKPLAEHISSSAERAVRNLEALCRDEDPVTVLKRIKFETVGFDPLGERKLNLIEQVNQTFTYLASLKAAAYLLEKHPVHAPYKLNLGTVSGSDVESRDGKVAAEVFAAVAPTNNRKLAKDLEKVAATRAKHRYVFHACPGYDEPAERAGPGKHSKVTVVSLGMNLDIIGRNA